MEQSETRGVVILGAGPAGSTAAAFLARAGQDVLILERRAFPRFHVGESLLPATVPIFERLGVLEELRRRFVFKPGAAFVFGDNLVEADFARCDAGSPIAANPYSFMVERSAFDTILLQNAVKAGAEVRHGWTALDLVREDDRVVGVRVRAEGQGDTTIGARWVLDCTGHHALLTRRLGLWKRGPLNRLAVFAHYSGPPRHPRLRQGWFVGRVFEDGWVWLIPLTRGRVSVGVVTSRESLAEIRRDPEAYLDRLRLSSSVLRHALPDEAERISPVHMLGDIGTTSSRLYGSGWAACGDAGFFIDPLFSSGVHLAMLSAQGAADVLLEALPSGREPDFEAWERELRDHEAAVLGAVASFYAISKSRACVAMAPAANNRLTGPRISTFLAGDFGRHRTLIRAGARVGSWMARATR